MKHRNLRCFFSFVNPQYRQVKPSAGLTTTTIDRQIDSMSMTDLFKLGMLGAACLVENYCG